jgi:hypothetical protein
MKCVHNGTQYLFIWFIPETSGHSHKNLFVLKFFSLGKKTILLLLPPPPLLLLLLHYMNLHIHSPICLHVVVLNQLRTGTTLP